MGSNAVIREQHQSSPSTPWHKYINDNHPPHSQWLHATSTDMDNKMKTILELIDNDGDTFAARAEMYYQKKPQLIKILQEYHQSYHALADKYDHLKSESSIKLPAAFSSPLTDSVTKATSNKPLVIQDQEDINSSSTTMQYSAEELSIEGRSASCSEISRSSNIFDHVHESPQNVTKISSDNVKSTKEEESRDKKHLIKQDELIRSNIGLSNHQCASGKRNQSHDQSKRKLRGIFCMR